ncbi:MAG: hypothetical protein AAFW69_01240 [Pseudomonadota bacterium]
MNLHAAFDPARWMPRRGENPMTYMLSLSPMAPVFGVSWRFAEVVADPTFAKGPTPKAAARAMTAAVEEAKAVADEVIEAAAEVVETAQEVQKEAVKAATDTTAEIVEAAIEGRPAKLYKKKPSKADDLKLLKGVGPKLEQELNALGIYTFDQIAGMTEANLAWVDGMMESFKGRAFRDNWVAQAQEMMKR